MAIKLWTTFNSFKKKEEKIRMQIAYLYTDL